MIKVVAFDVYGTLLDTASAVRHLAPRLVGKTEQVAADWRRRQLEYTWLRSLMGQYADFRQVTSDALDWTLAAHGLDDPGLKFDLMQLYETLAAFEDAPATLAQARAMGLKLCVLSNGTEALLRSGLSAAGIEGMLEAVLTVESVGIYKPHPDVYRLVCDRFGVSAGEVAFVSANGWDAAGAAAFGFRTAWLNRQTQPQECLPGRPEVILPSLAALVPWLEAGLSD